MLTAALLGAAIHPNADGTRRPSGGQRGTSRRWLRLLTSLNFRAQHKLDAPPSAGAGCALVDHTGDAPEAGIRRIAGWVGIDRVIGEMDVLQLPGVAGLVA
jgi:hypothetical protein